MYFHFIVSIKCIFIDPVIDCPPVHDVCLEQLLYNRQRIQLNLTVHYYPAKPTQLEKKGLLNNALYISFMI